MFVKLLRGKEHWEINISLDAHVHRSHMYILIHTLVFSFRKLLGNSLTNCQLRTKQFSVLIRQVEAKNQGGGGVEDRIILSLRYIEKCIAASMDK